MRLKWPTFGRREGGDPHPEESVLLETRASRPRRPSRRGRERPGVFTVVPRVLLGLAVLYAVLLLTFWTIHYEGERPGAGQVIQDFHAYLGLGPGEAKAAPPPPLPPLEPVRIEPEPPAPPPPPSPPEPSRLDRIADTIREVQREAKTVREKQRGGELEAAQLELVSRLCDARDQLNVILDADPDNDRANGLWDKLQQVLVALRKL